MKTKEAIFKDLWPKLYVPETANIEAPVYAAMDEFAKQQAIAFGEWIRENKWFPQGHLGKPDCWRFFNHDTEEEQEKSTQQLHAQFIDSQNNKL